MKVILIPGSGATPQDHWFPYLEKELSELGIKVINRQFPDFKLARKEYWLPFIKELGPDEHTILVAHSAGTAAAMKYAEEHKLLGSILVAALYTDVGDDMMKQSGYFDSPWNWDTIKNNQQWIIQFASQDDPYIPIAEAHYIHEKLETEYHEYSKEGHFGYPKQPKYEFPELVEALKKRVGK